jgi:hypothetical protein
MNRFLVIGFDFCASFYYSLILCKAKNYGTEYRITVMHGDIEKQVCNNNIIKEINGCLHIELSGNTLQDQIKTEIGKALGRIIGKTVKEVEMHREIATEGSHAKELPAAQNCHTSNGL